MACPATIWMVMLFPKEATCWKKMTAQYPDFPAHLQDMSSASRLLRLLQPQPDQSCRALSSKETLKERALVTLRCAHPTTPSAH